MMNRVLLALLAISLLISCGEDKEFEKKGFQVNEIEEDEQGNKVVGLKLDSLLLETRPQNVLLTSNPAHRITPIYKVSYNKKTKKPFVGSNCYHQGPWDQDPKDENNWNRNYMPGYEAIYGYNFVNVSHYDNMKNVQNQLFDTPVLIKTFYYPAFSKDTLNSVPVKRTHYMASVYDQDTNKDGYITVKDLRHFYLFDVNGKRIKQLIPENYSVMSSEYDSANDYMYVFAKLDKNANGQMESGEPTHIFWVDLKNPMQTGIQYK